MNDLSDIVPLAASVFGLAPSTLLLVLAIVHLAAKFGSRMIPNNATGALATLRNICTVLGVDPSNRVAPGVTVQDVTAQALATPPITQKVAAAAAPETPNA